MDEPAAAVAHLGHQPGSFQHGDVALHGGEAHRVSPGEVGDGLLLAQHPGDDVAAGGVRQCGEDAVDPVLLLRGVEVYK